MFSKLANQFSSVSRKIIEGARRDDEEIQKLKSKFQEIQAELEREENEQLKDDAVVDMLKVIDASWGDLMSNSTMRQVCTSISFYPFSRRRLVLPRDVASKLENLRRKLDANDVKRYWLDREKELERNKTSVIDSSLEVLGRDEDNNRLVELLLSESSQAPTLPVISIVGTAGIGKTTLARHVFNNDAVKTHFDKRIWVCASSPLDEIRVAKTILESLKDGASNVVEIETVLQHISHYIRGKKFLLVLDDVCTEYSRYWEQLKYYLKSSSQGSRILVTTRQENIADKMGTTETISLGRLSEEGASSLFYQVALRNNDDRQELEHIGLEIVGKCNGLPLGVKIIGSLLRFKRSSGDWENVLDSEVWTEEVGEELFRPLLLSYHYLPSILKKCFSYCAIFPKNYEIEKDRLIKLWMSQGYLKVEGREDMEFIGEECFRNLATLSLFQDFEKDNCDDRIVRCRMHDSVLNFARSLPKNECFTLEFGFEKSQFEREFSNENLQHLMIMFEREGTFPISVYNRKKLCSLLVEPGEGFMTGIVLTELFDKLTYLRALDLSNQDNIYYKVIKEVPRGIKKLTHLRYLNLSHNSKIKKLPETLCELYNLESLELSWCINLKNLPQRIGKLINMRHVVNEGTSLSYMPRGIERLTCLRTLSEFIVGGRSDDGKACALECLKNLNHLQGSLRIKKLGNVNKDEINNAELMKKKILHLYLSFDKDEEKERKNEDDENAFEDLQLPPELERLEICYYRGSRLSLLRIMSLSKLRMMSLDRCMNLEQLPRLGELPSLKSLTIRKMRSLEKVGNEFLGTDQSSSTGKPFVAFPKLESLEFQKMNGWKEWKYTVTRRTGEDTKIMPCLSSLKIGFCPELETLPDDYLTQTLELKIISCPKLKEHYKEGTEERQKISHIKVSFD